MSSEVLTNLIDTLEDALRDFIDTERERVETERDFLLNVLNGRSDGVTVEDLSTDLTKIYLSGYLSVYVPIENDISGSTG
jgi:hypothetical protein